MRTISYSEARQNLSATMMKAVEDHAPILITFCTLPNLKLNTKQNTNLIESN